jgi:hypothetical protein
LHDRGNALCRQYHLQHHGNGTVKYKLLSTTQSNIRRAEILCATIGKSNQLISIAYRSNGPRRHSRSRPCRQRPADAQRLRRRSSAAGANDTSGANEGIRIGDGKEWRERKQENRKDNRKRQSHI